MACAHPLQIKNPLFRQLSFHRNTRFPTLEVPCGWCLNCRVDKRNTLEDKCDYEYKQFGCGAFVTFTYDDYHIESCMEKDKKDNLVASLRKDDVTKFIKRLRERIKYSKLDYKYCRPDFKYLIVGEYGENGQLFDRPHYHALFFGLDFQVCERLFLDCWSNGFIDSLPIRNGAIRYVLKYMDKQQHGVQAISKFDDNNLERPFCHKSQGLGVGLYISQIDFIKAHNGNYKTKHNILRPIPTYYKNKLKMFTVVDNSSKRAIMSTYKVKPDCNDVTGKSYSLKQLNSFAKYNALVREKNLIELSRQDGVPCFDPLPITCTQDFDSLTTVAINIADPIPF